MKLLQICKLLDFHGRKATSKLILVQYIHFFSWRNDFLVYLRDIESISNRSIKPSSQKSSLFLVLLLFLDNVSASIGKVNEFRDYLKGQMDIIIH